MHSLEEKNHLSNELERTKKKVEEAEQNKARLQSQLEAQNLEIYNLRLFGQSQHALNAVEYRYVKQLVYDVINTLFLFSLPPLSYLTNRDPNISGGNIEGVTKVSSRSRKHSKANASARNTF